MQTDHTPFQFPLILCGMSAGKQVYVCVIFFLLSFLLSLPHLSLLWLLFSTALSFHSAALVWMFSFFFSFFPLTFSHKSLMRPE